MFLTEHKNLKNAANVLEDIDIPIINISNIESTSDFQSAVVAELTGIHSCMQKISESCNRMDAQMERLENRFEHLEEHVKQL